MLTIDQVPALLQPDRHLPIAEEGGTCVLLVDDAHQQQIKRRLSGRLLVEGGPVQTNQRTLPSHADRRVWTLDHATLYLNRTG